jgi:cation transport protein ChaC
MMKRRQSGRRRGAGDMSGMRRPLDHDFVKCKRPDPARKDAEIASLPAFVLIAVREMSSITLPETHFPTGDLWVFGYGSLMWRPGFEFEERVQARLIGEHRALCVYSFVHRGTPEKPGLVLGLDRGGACRGIAFRVAEKNRAATVAYLRDREQVTSVYREVKRSVWLENEARARVSALAYVVDRGHVQYAGRLSPAEQLRHVIQGHGQSGVNRDYVLATVKAIEAEGFRDAPLHQLAMMLHDSHPSPALMQKDR